MPAGIRPKDGDSVNDERGQENAPDSREADIDDVVADKGDAEEPVSVLEELACQPCPSIPLVCEVMDPCWAASPPPETPSRSRDTDSRWSARPDASPPQS